MAISISGSDCIKISVLLCIWGSKIQRFVSKSGTEMTVGSQEKGKSGGKLEGGGEKGNGGGERV